MATSAANLNKNCYTPLGACIIRATRLKAGGSYAPRPNNVVVSDAVIDVSAKLNVVKGDNFSQKDGCGNTRVTFQGCDKLDSADLTINFLEFDPQLFEMLTGGSLFVAGGKVVGYQPPTTAAVCPNGVALEMWSPAWDGDQQAVDTVTGLPVYFRLGFPKTTWTVSDMGFGNDITKQPLVGHGVANAQFLTGPYADWPSVVNSVYGWYYDTAIPAASCGYLSRVES